MISTTSRGRNFRVADDGGYETTARGLEVLETPFLNKGSAFTLSERDELGLTGLLPPAVTTIMLQAERSYTQYGHHSDDLARYIFLSALHDRNEALYYRVLGEHLAEMLPIIYTPTVGTAIQRYSQEFRRPRGVYLSIDDPDSIDDAFRNFGAGPEDIDLIVATDAEQILGIGDWGVGGVSISIGKLSVYTAAAGIDPTRVIPLMLDVGTDRAELLDYPAYMGCRHARVRGERYDAFIDAYVQSARTHFPNALFHWEDFGASNARRILDRYRTRLSTFNDDMQGTGAVVLGAVIAACRAAGMRLADQRVVIFGAGTAGIGIADSIRDAMVRDGLPYDEAMSRFWCLGRRGLLVDDMAHLMRDFQAPYSRPAAEVKAWHRDGDGDARGIHLQEVVREVHPTLLVGCSASPGAFTEQIIREMAAHAERPIIFSLSNPTSLSEAVPSDLIAWTDGRALVATGSPFPQVTHDGTRFTIGQANNALVFPGIGLGTIVTRASAVSDGMLAAAAAAVADMVEPGGSGASIMPSMDRLRDVSIRVAVAVATAAVEEGLARTPPDDVEAQVRSAMWEPTYKPVRAV